MPPDKAPGPRLKIKTDNASLAEKCQIRRQLFEEAKEIGFDFEPLRVLDLFAGEGNIWTELRRTPRPDPGMPPEAQIRALNVLVYTPVDREAKQPGQIKFKVSPRLIAALDENEGLRRYNCIDIDTYGEPWEIWREVLFHIKQPTAVFLTRGKVTYGAGRMPISKTAKQVMGMPEHWDVPGKHELLAYADRAQLLQPCPTARITLGLWKPHQRVDYYGLVVEPIAPASE
jgi:hypothetical protein